VNKFFLGELQSLCKPCHDSANASLKSTATRPISVWTVGHLIRFIQPIACADHAHAILPDGTLGGA
jgi:hypothetical protein